MSITLLACEMSAVVRSFEHSLALPFFGIGMKTDLFQSYATAEFSKFAGILSAALSQHFSVKAHVIFQKTESWLDLSKKLNSVYVR